MSIDSGSHVIVNKPIPTYVIVITSQAYRQTDSALHGKMYANTVT